MKSEEKFSIIIPSHNGMGVLPQCMEALKAQTYNNFEVIVVLNLTTDDSEKYLRSLNGLDVQIVREDTIASSYAARNLGLASVSGDLIAFIDDDCIPLADWLENALEYLRKYDMVAGHIELYRESDHNIWEQMDAKMHVNQRNYSKKGMSAGGNLLIRNSVFLSQGIFPVEIVSGADMLWSKSATEKGFSMIYAPDVRVLHHSKKTFVSMWKKRYRIGIGHAQTGTMSVKSFLIKLVSYPFKKAGASVSQTLSIRLTLRERLLFIILAAAYLNGLFRGIFFKTGKKRLQ
ncbi:glycosyltransferase family 2 protein [Candidatus Calescamantes bacterium]|nr:glycosyltransferase family 2 protein [Candidatus Calescamantes bacterium]MCK5598569.1 glycosyltransferase family 2 protein [bacterium]